MKPLLLTAIVLFKICGIAIAQNENLLVDTIAIEEVSIIGRPVSGESGYKLSSFSGEIIEQTLGLPVSNLLGRESSLGIKNYGPGGLATSSFRGLSANQTKVIWEGVPINSPGTGQIDLSLIPVSSYQRVDLYHGATSVINGASGPGGTISLRTVPQWSRGMETIFSQNIGSFGYLSEDLSIAAGSEKIQLVSRVFTRKARNNFPYSDYINYTPPELVYRRENNYKVIGGAQDIFVKYGKSIISANLWYSQGSRDLPGPIITGTSNDERQIDKQFRLATGLKRYSDHLILDFKIGALSDYFLYRNRLADIVSVTNSSSSYFSTFAKYKISDDSSIKLSLSNRYNTINSINHKGFRSLNQAVLKSEYSISVEEIFSLILLVEASHSNSRFYRPVVSVGADLRLTQKGLLYLKGNLGTSLTTPTLNDLYWIPGGNPDLKNETGINSELTLELRDNTDNNFKVGGEVTIYNSRIKGLIKWLPGDYGIWSPQNIDDISSMGSEVDFTGTYKPGRSEIRVRINYSYTRIVNADKAGLTGITGGKQLIYVPFNQARLNLEYQYGNLTLLWYSDFIGKRYTTSDNSLSLPVSLSSDFDIKYNIRGKRHNLLTSFRICNIFNADIEYIAYYPLPRRNYLFTFTYKFKKYENRSK